MIALPPSHAIALLPLRERVADEVMRGQTSECPSPCGTIAEREEAQSLF
jgi:hypothetical protein